MILGIFILVVALVLSSIAAFYSIVGLVAIFAAAVLPIILMGATLEVAKITVTVWLHNNWQRCRWPMKVYLTAAVFALMFITSMGIFGFLSKSHVEQAADVKGNALLIENIDREIETQRKLITDSNTVVAQLDAAVASLLAADRIRGSSGSLAVRSQQRVEREQLSTAVAAANAKIAELSQQKLPLQQSLQKLETEVGPLKYIAALIYGDNPSANLLESAVRGVIILLVTVFDPLAIMMVLAATESFRWHAESKVLQNLKKTEAVEPRHPLPKKRWRAIDRATAPTVEPDDPAEFVEPVREEIQPTPVSEEVEPAAAKKDPEEPTTVVGKRLVSDMAELDRQQTVEGHVQIGDKYYHADTLSEMLKALPGQANTGIKFGVTFPSRPKINEMYLRVDYLPTRLFRFDGQDWVLVDKETTNRPIYDQAYIEMLITKIGQGEYSPSWLTETERAQIEKILQSDLNQTGA